MLNKLIIFFIINIFSIFICNANWIDELSKCFSNPCNCGYGDYTEQWGEQTIKWGPRNPLCPPWNKTGGRANNTCIVGSTYPSASIFSTIFACIEETPESNYFSPKVKVRHQTCNTIACWGQNTTLKWDGECVVWPGPVALPMLRICARVAMPEQSKPSYDPNKPPTITPADPGYSLRVHTDSEGIIQPDDIVFNRDGKPLIFDQPKLCVYKDPGLFDFVSGVLDVMDYNPENQIIHKTGGVHPIGKVLLFILDQGVELGKGIEKILEKILGVVTDQPATSTDSNQTNQVSPDPVATLMYTVLRFILKLYTLFGEAFKKAITDITQFNRVVDANLGCVKLPEGPNPPPYIDPLGPFYSNVNIQPICVYNDDGTRQKANEKNKCVIGGQNNIINNIVRISLDNLIPMCPIPKPGTPPPDLSDKCVTISGDTVTASTLHRLSNNLDYIHSCANPLKGKICVNTTLKEPIGGYRITYGIRIGNSVIPNNYYIEEEPGYIPDPNKKEGEGTATNSAMPDCLEGDNRVCQTVYGINAGEYKDVVLRFPEQETEDAVDALTESIMLTDMDGNTHNINVFINRIETLDTISKSTIKPNQICANDGSKFIGCVERNLNISPSVYMCDAPNPANLTCESNIFNPKLIVGLKSGTDGSYIISNVPNIDDLQKYAGIPAKDIIINLAGYQFNAFATDDDYTVTPFTTNVLINSQSRYGNYRNGKFEENFEAYTIDNNTQTVTQVADAVYLNKLEYALGFYVRGGTKACIQQLEADKCPNNKSLCVLTSILNKDIVDCSTFSIASLVYNGLHRCPNPQPTGSALRTTLPGKNGGSGAEIYEYENQKITNYCYTTASNRDLCQIGFNYFNRVDPDANHGQNLTNDMYFHFDEPDKAKFDKSSFVMRDKTSAELGLCVDIPQLKCAAINGNEDKEGYALWPETDSGSKALGVCLDGYEIQSTKQPFARYCIADRNTKTVNFDILNTDITCIPSTASLRLVSNSFSPIYQVKLSHNNNNSSQLTIDSESTTNDLYQTYVAAMKLHIDDISKVTKCNVEKLEFNNYLLITINDKKVYSMPGDINDISQAPETPGADQSTTLDLISYITGGENDIKIYYKAISNNKLNMIFNYEQK